MDTMPRQVSGHSSERRTYKRTFILQQVKGKTYLFKILTESLMLYYLGDSCTRTAKHIGERSTPNRR